MMDTEPDYEELCRLLDRFDSVKYERYFHHLINVTGACRAYGIDSWRLVVEASMKDRRQAYERTIRDHGP